MQRLFALLLAAGFTPAAAAELPVLQDCMLPGLAEAARCGELRVPEDPDRPAGRQITVSFAVLPATGNPAQSDPIVPLHGGPGEDVIDDAGELAERFAALRATRDLLLIDQRGTGRSSALPCRLHDPANAGPNLRHFLPPAAVAVCERELSTRADLTQYTLLNFAHDLEAVRRALGYAQFNLYAGSYGTRAAQVLMRAYPRSVRTALLNGAAPMDFVTPLTMAKASQEAFEATFAACEAEAACRAAYPALRADFDAVLARLDAGTVRADVPGAPNALLVRGRVVEWLRALLYRPRTGAELPWLIRRAAEGDYAPIVAGILAHSRNVDEAFALGVWFSITCSEDLQFLREEDIAPASAGTFLGDYRVREQEVACRAWPKATMPAEYRQRLRSDVATTFVSGDLDAGSPLWFTAGVAPGFPNRVEVVLHGRGHTEWTACVDGLYRRFVESGAADGIDPACPATPRPPFRT